MKRLVLVAILFGVGGCGALDDMKSMKDLTEKMREATDDMRKTTKQVERLNCNMYGDVRQSTSATARKDNLNDLIENKEMGPKVSAAAKYVQSFEFQVLKGSDLACQTDQSDEILANGVLEFFLEFMRFFDSRDAREVDVDPADRPARFKNMFALALAMEFKNINQYNDEPTRQGDTVSIMDLIFQGLSYSAAVEREQVKFADLPNWVQRVLQNEDKAVYIFQLRLNFQLGLLINQITGIEGYSFFRKVWFDRWQNTGNRTWDPKFEHDKIPELENIMEFASGALRTKRAIHDFNIPGVEPKMDRRMKRYLSHMEKYQYKLKDRKQALVEGLYQTVESLLESGLPDKGRRDRPSEVPPIP